MKQHVELDNTHPSCQALVETSGKFIEYLESTFDLTPVQATWMCSSIMSNLANLTEISPTMKSGFAEIAKFIKSHHIVK